MVLLNTALCLPELEIDVLSRGLSVVAVPKRFIVPGKRFALLPVQALPGSFTADQLYHKKAVEEFEFIAVNKQEVPTIQLWGKCEFCQHLTDQAKVQALSHRTIWKIDALAEHLRNQENLFLVFIRVYRLANPAGVSPLSTDESLAQVNNFVPLAQYLDVDEAQPVLEDDRFLELKQKLIDLKAESYPIPPDETSHKESTNELEILKKDPLPDILNDPKWFSKIAEVGNSSDGFSFEKLVRKSFSELGFQNSEKNSRASIDPMATGGAGGLDFYADKPYPIVGECKATKSDRVPSGTPAQLIRIGHSILQEHYNECIKIIVVAGDLTPGAHLTSENNSISIIRPETLQKLVELKMAYPGSIDLLDLKSVLNAAPFGEEADQRINDFISDVWQCLTVRSLLVEAVRRFCIQEGNKSVTDGDVRVYYNAVFAKDSPPLPRNEIRDLLVELSSPLTAYIGRENSNDGTERFYFLQELKIED